MKHLHLTLGYLRDERARIDQTIATLEALINGRSSASSNGNGSNGNGHRATLKHAADALALHDAHAAHATSKPKPGPKPGRKRAPSTMRPLPVVDVPHGLDVSGLPLNEAIPAALKAYKKPASTKQLTALLLGAGFPWDKPQPMTVRVGSMCGRGEVDGVKGTPAGWRLR